MKRILTIMTAVSLLCTLNLTPDGFAAPAPIATVQATTNLNGNFPPPNPRNNDSGIIILTDPWQEAQSQDQISYHDSAAGFTISGDVKVRVGAGYLKFFQDLYAEGPEGIGMASVLSGRFTDKAVVGFDDKSPQAGTMEVHPILDGKLSGEMGTYNIDLTLFITIHNLGSEQSPKDLTYQIMQQVQFSNLGDNQSSSGPNSFTLTSGDVVEILVSETLVGYVIADGLMSKYTADFFNTTHVYLDSLTPGFTMIAESGHDYRTPKSTVEESAWVFYE